MGALLALAFGAGVIAPLNPCGIALLPTYLTYHLDVATRSGRGGPPAAGLKAGAALTVGFAGTLAVLAGAVSLGARSLLTLAPWAGLATGTVLAVLGALMLIGIRVPLRLPGLAAKSGNAPAGTGRLALFGVGYAVASMACTFGVLLAVIAQASAVSSITALLGVLAAYVAGAAVLLMLLAVSVASAGSALTRRITGLARYTGRLSGGVLLLSGLFLAYYWFPAATGRPSSTGLGVERWAAQLSGWVQAHQTAVVVLAAVAVATAVASSLVTRLRHRKQGPEDCCTPTNPGSDAEQHQ